MKKRTRMAARARRLIGVAKRVRKTRRAHRPLSRHPITHRFFDGPRGHPPCARFREGTMPDQHPDKWARLEAILTTLKPGEAVALEALATDTGLSRSRADDPDRADAQRDVHAERRSHVRPPQLVAGKLTGIG